MAKLEISLGDALFSVDFNSQETWSTSKWQDTPHFHVDSEIHIISEGDAVMEINGKDVHMNPGDVCVLAPRTSHYPKVGSDDLKKANFSFRLTQNHNRKEKVFSEYVYYNNIFKSVSGYFVVNDPELPAIVQRLVAQPFSGESEHIYLALLAVFFIALAKRIREHHLPYQEQLPRVAAENENSARQRKKVEEFFQKRYHQEISIEDLAEELCLSVPHTHRIVKKVFDEGFKKTLIKQRIEHACMLIKQRDLPLAEIAVCCGYTSYNGFLSAFKSYMGKTPKEYEKSIR